MTLTRITLLAVALACGPAAAADNTIVVRDDIGGLMSDYIGRIMKWETEGRRVKITGRCYSACALYLGIPGVCVHKDAELGFHSSWPVGPDMEPANQVAMEIYPPKVRRWVRRNGGLTEKTIYLKGKELRRTVRICP